MRVTVGLSDTPREIELELDDADEFLGKMQQAVSEGAGLVWATGADGHRYGIAAAKVAYIHIEPEKERRVGLGP